MDVTLNWQTLLTCAAAIGAAVAIYKYVADVVRWIDTQKKQSDEIEELKKIVAEKESALKELIESAQTRENSELEKLRTDVNNELMLVNYGLLACLKGLAEQGCNGPVHEAISKIEKHLNQKAHQ